MLPNPIAAVTFLLMTICFPATGRGEVINSDDYEAPGSVGSTWVYKAMKSPKDKSPETTIVTVVDDYFPINVRQETGWHEVDAIQMLRESGRMKNGAFVRNKKSGFSRAFEYTRPGPGYWVWGLEDLASNSDWVQSSFMIRDGFGTEAQMRVGSTSTMKRPVYLNSHMIGKKVKFSVLLAGREAVQVPAGRFDDCIKLRFTMDFAGGTTITDEWWARGVGMVKSVDRSTPGTKASEVLVSANIKEVVPFVPAAIGITGGLQFLSQTGPNSYQMVFAGPTPSSRAITLTNTGTGVLRDLSVHINSNEIFHVNPIINLDLRGGESVTFNVDKIAPIYPYYFAGEVEIRCSNSDVEPIVIRVVKSPYSL